MLVSEFATWSQCINKLVLQRVIVRKVTLGLTLAVFSLAQSSCLSEAKHQAVKIKEPGEIPVGCLSKNRVPSAEEKGGMIVG